MLKSTKLFVSLFLFLLAASLTPSAHADTFTYKFDYTGVGTLSEAKGTGSFSYDSVTRDVTAFSFSDTFYNVTLSGLQQAASFSYFGTSDIVYQGMLLFPNGTLAGIDITTVYKDATTGSGSANFSFNYAVGLNADGTTSNKLRQNTIGTGTVTLFSDVPAATPEPSSLMLLGTGILGVAGALRRKMRA